MLEVPSLLRQSYPYCISDPERGGRSIDPHCALVGALISLSFGIVYIVRLDNMRSMCHVYRWAEVRPMLPTLTQLPLISVNKEQHKQKRPYSGAYGPSSHFPESGSLPLPCLHHRNNVLRLTHTAQAPASLPPSRADFGLRTGITYQVP